MAMISVRLEYYAKWSAEKPQVSAVALYRDEIDFAFLPRAGDTLRILDSAYSSALGFVHEVAFVEHSLSGESAPDHGGVSLRGESCIVCRGPWPPAEADADALDALLDVEATGWSIYPLNEEVIVRLAERRRLRT